MRDEPRRSAAQGERAQPEAELAKREKRMEPDSRTDMKLVVKPEPRGRGRRPRPVDMERDDAGMAIVWDDGHRSVHAYDDLRRLCPCATCRTERERAAAAPAGGLRVLPADAPVRAVLAGIEWVGWYAFRLSWEDGHDTGIYAFDYLRELCGCAECSPPRDLSPASG